MVGDPQVGLVAGADKRDFDALRIGRAVDGVGQDVQEHLPDPTGVGPDLQVLPGTVISTPMTLAECPRHLGSGTHEPVQIDVGVLKRQLAGVAARGIRRVRR